MDQILPKFLPHLSFFFLLLFIFASPIICVVLRIKKKNNYARYE